MEKESVVVSGYSASIGSSDNYPFSSKTFWVALVCIALGVYLIVIDKKEEGLQLVMLGLGLLGIRDAIRKVEKK